MRLLLNVVGDMIICNKGQEKVIWCCALALNKQRQYKSILMSSSWDTAEIELETETVHPEVKMDQENIWDHLEEKKRFISKFEDYDFHQY